MVTTGLDALRQRGFDRLREAPFALLCNQATITADCRHVLDLLPDTSPKAIFGPQHGLWGHTQDNMIEWEGGDSGGVPIYSLYGAHRSPTEQMLAGCERLVVDLPDIGSRYYTFAWTMALCMETCARLGIPMLVLDRPNPLGGEAVEGPGLDPEFRSFVGLHSIPVRHGLTLGELALLLKATAYPELELEIEHVQGWRREQMFPETELPWAMPSPNMPAFDTALVYPGGCLLEGTELSEGRGTTRPFEMLGAPYLKGADLASALNSEGLPGVWFRPVQFQPTFQKFAGQICEGCFVHVTDRRSFRPVRTYASVIRHAYQQSEGQFAWKPPPYEYEFEKLPIDILWGCPWLREAVEGRRPWCELDGAMAINWAPEHLY